MWREFYYIYCAISLPDQWSRRDTCAGFVADGPVGHLRLFRPGDQEKVAHEFLVEGLRRGVPLINVRCGAFPGLSCSYVRGIDFMRKWLVYHHSGQFLEITYVCKAEDIDAELDILDQIVATIKTDVMWPNRPSYRND